MGKVVGIDLGTTNSVVAVMEGGKGRDANHTLRRGVQQRGGAFWTLDRPTET